MRNGRLRGKPAGHVRVKLYLEYSIPLFLRNLKRIKMDLKQVFEKYLENFKFDVSQFPKQNRLLKLRQWRFSGSKLKMDFRD